ncbi:AMP-binding protein [Thermodesulfobacteriota bacterium]
MVDIDVLSKMNFAELVEFRAKSPETRSKTFIMAFKKDTSAFTPITFEAFYHEALRYGNLIEEVKRRKEIKRGDPFNVGIIMNNYPEFLYAQAGCAFTNSTLVAVNTLRVSDGLAHDVNYTDLGLLLTDEDIVRNAIDASALFTNLSRDFIFVRGRESESDVIQTIEDFLVHCPPVEDFVPQRLDDMTVGMIIFTSGTTGAPKGIEITWKKLMDVGFTSINFLKYDATDIGYICMPLGHSNSMYLNYMPALIAGASIGLRSRFSSSKFVSDIDKCNATIWNCVGKPVTYILSTVGNTDYSDAPLRITVSTGTTADEQEKFTKAFGLDRFIEAYGQTETGAITVKTDDSDRDSTGKRNPARPFLILNENYDATGFRKVLDSNQVGEIAVDNEALGDSAFWRYYRNESATQSKLYMHSNGRVYYLTGDLGKVDAQDNLYFMGRTGDWYRKKGENRAESAAEEYLIKFGDIITIAAFGIPDSQSQEDYLIATIEVDDPQNFDIQGFIEYSNSGDKGVVPDFVRVVNEMPKTSTSKIIKRSVKAAHLKRSGDPQEQSTDIVYRVMDNRAGVFGLDDYRMLIDAYLPQSRERLDTFLKRAGGSL